MHVCGFQRTYHIQTLTQTSFRLCSTETRSLLVGARKIVHSICISRANGRSPRGGEWMASAERLWCLSWSSWRSRPPRGAPRKARPMRSFGWSEWANRREDNVVGKLQMLLCRFGFGFGALVNPTLEVFHILKKEPQKNPKKPQKRVSTSFIRTRLVLIVRKWYIEMKT